MSSDLRLRQALVRSRFYLAVAGLYLLLRLFSAAVLARTAQEQDPSWIGDDDPYLHLTSGWDGSWYKTIATKGYPDELPRAADGQVRQNPWAFYPAFPLLCRLVMSFTGNSFAAVATTLALVLGLAAALVMAHVMRTQLNDAAAVATVLLYASFPASPVLQMAYTESLAMLLLCCFLWAIMRERWLVAAGLALLTGVSRPIALPLGLVALVAVIVRWRRSAKEPMPLEEWVRGGAALVACGVSGLLWPTYAAYRTGESDAYELTMRSWRSGREIVPFEDWKGNFEFLFGEAAMPMMLAAIAITVGFLVLGPWARGLGPVLRTWCLGYSLYLGAVLNPWTSTFRYLLPLFPIFAILVGAAWGRGRDALRRGDPGDGHLALGARRVAYDTLVRPEAALVGKVGLFVLWFLAWQVVWVWELVLFRPPADDPP